jgi:hypothetical protein
MRNITRSEFEYYHAGKLSEHWTSKGSDGVSQRKTPELVLPTAHYPALGWFSLGSPAIIFTILISHIANVHSLTQLIWQMNFWGIGGGMWNESNKSPLRN